MSALICYRDPHRMRWLSSAKEAGFSYVEVLAAMILMGVCLVPLLDGLHSMTMGPAILAEKVVNRLALQAKMDAVLVQPFADLTAAATQAGSLTVPTTYSDLFTSTDNRQFTRNVYMSHYDGNNLDGDNDPFTDTDPTLLYIQVAITGQQPLESLVGR